MNTKAQAEAMASQICQTWLIKGELDTTALEKLLAENERLKEYIQTVEGEKKIAVDCGHNLCDQLTATEARLETALGLIRGLIDGAVHPEIAVRRVMVDLTPFRAFLSTLTAEKKEQG